LASFAVTHPVAVANAFVHRKRCIHEMKESRYGTSNLIKFSQAAILLAEAAGSQHLPLALKRCRHHFRHAIILLTVSGDELGYGTAAFFSKSSPR
jgi:hypothetical protein